MIVIPCGSVDWLTAGRAKNEMPRMEQKAAISFPGQVLGTESP